MTMNIENRQSLHVIFTVALVIRDITYQLWRHYLSRRHASFRKRRWWRTAVQDVENASFPCLKKKRDRGKIENDHLYDLCCPPYH